MTTIRRLLLGLLCTLLLTGSLCTVHAAEPITITSQPKSVMVANGSTATVKVSASGSGLSYLWYRKLATEKNFSSTGVTSSTYSITMSYEASGQHVYCRITDSKGNTVNSGFAVLNSSDVGITFTNTLSDQRVKPMATNWLYAQATGPIWKYAWYESGSSDTGYYLDRTKASRALVLSQGSVVYTYCVVTCHAGYTVATNIAKFTTNEPRIIDCSPKANFFTGDEPFTLFVDAVGDDITYEWTSSPVYMSLMPSAEERKFPTLTMTMSKELDGAYFYCKVFDSHYNCVETHDMYVFLPELDILEHPKGAELVAGMEATASIKAVGENLIYRWYCSYDDGEESLLPSTSADVAVTLNEPGNYSIRCVVTDKSGQTRRSNYADFKVYAPVYIKKDIKDAKVAISNSVRFDLLVEGCGVTYRWYCKDPGSKSYAVMPGETASLCSFIMDSSTNGRKLYCIATDIAGNTVRSATVTATIDSSLTMRGNCTICGGDGNCDRCGGDGWYYKIYFDVSKNEHVNENVRCDSGVCMFGSCTNCGGDGWSGSSAGLKAGDANQDSKVNKADILLVMQHAAGWDVTINKQTADVNASGVIDVYDAVRILQYIADN